MSIITSAAGGPRRFLSELALAASRLSLRHHLLLVVLATALPLLGLSIILVEGMVEKERNETVASLMNNAKTMAALVDNEVSDHAAIAATLTHSTALKTGDFEKFDEEAREALEFLPGSWLVLADASGKVLVHTLYPYGSKFDQPLNTGIEAKVFATGKPQVSDLVRGPVSKRPAAFLEMPVYRNGAPAYVIAISLAPERFLNLLKNKLNGGELVGILDREGKFFARVPDHEGRIGRPASDSWLKARAASSQGLIENITLEGAPALTAYTSTANGWTVGISLPKRVIEAPVERLLERLGLLAAVLVALSLFVAYLLASRFADSMNALTAMASDLGVGKPVIEPRLAFTEAAIIANALVEASEELQRKDAAISRFTADLEQKVADRTRELVAEMKRREESEAKLRHMQKMEAVGQLTGGIAHDFNNMMAIVLGSLYLLERRLAKGDLNVSALINEARQGAERAVSLTKRLLAFSRRQALSPQPTDVNRLIADMSDLLRRTVPENINIETILGGGLWRTYVDPNELENAVLNLVSNARDAMAEGGKLTIETANAHLDDAYAASHAEVNPGQYVLIAITDTGPGMPPEVLAKAFEPFFTTKPPGVGTGLGLSQVHGFIKQSGGHVKIYSEEGHGVSVKLYLPRYFGNQNETSVHEEAPRPAPTSKAHELILVVEDDPAVLRSTTGMLAELGYRTLSAESGLKALKILDANPQIRLMLTDIVMPGMNGRQLADTALSRRPDLKIIYTTGYTRNAVVHNGVVDPDVQLLMKPFSVEALALKLEQLLSEK